MDSRKLTDAANPLRRGESGGTLTRTSQATGEALLVPLRNQRKKIDCITGETGKSVEDERVTEWPVGAKKSGNADGAKGPYCL
jgi:hypothetical protein